MSMDCRTVREVLDLSREQRQDWCDTELREAASHVEGCAACLEVLTIHEACDRRLRHAMSQLQVPLGLKNRLLATCQAALLANEQELLTPDSTALPVKSTEPVAPVTQAEPTRSRRVRRGWVLLATAASLLCAVSAWYWSNAAVTAWSMDELSLSLVNQLMADPEQTAPRDFTTLPMFAADFDADVYDLLWADSVSQEKRGLDLDANPGQEAAVYQFELRQGRLAGLLVVMSKQSVLDPPGDDAPSQTNVRYNPLQQVSWTRGEQVYICIMTRGSIDDLLSQMTRLS